MNVILVLIDSLNRHYLESYGAAEGSTPNFARFARRALRFDNHFVGSLPCMPARRELFTGRKDFLWRPWGHVEPFDTLLPHVASEHGYKTMLITDHYHYWEENANGYMESFQGLEMIRGHELDNWNVDPLGELPSWVKSVERYRPGQGRRYFSNVRNFHTDDDFFSAKVFKESVAWLDRNYNAGQFYLQVELFDVHEPFHVPDSFRSMWLSEDDPDNNCWPPYQDRSMMQKYFSETTQKDWEFVRSQYKAKVSVADKWFGTLLDKLDQLQAWEDTVVIVSTDHGHDLGERQAFGKQYPHYDSHANIPLFVWHPSMPVQRHGSHVAAITSTVDLNPTLIEIMGVQQYEAPHGRSILPVIMGATETHRDQALYGMYGFGAAVTDGNYVLIQGYDNSHPIHLYSTRIPRLPKRISSDSSFVSQIESGFYIPGVNLPVWKIPANQMVGSNQSTSVLYERTDTPFSEENRFSTDVALRKRMQSLLRETMEEEGTPQEQYVRLGLPT